MFLLQSVEVSEKYLRTKFGSNQADSPRNNPDNLGIGFQGITRFRTHPVFKKLSELRW